MMLLLYKCSSDRTNKHKYWGITVLILDDKFYTVNIILHVFVEWNRVQFMQHYMIKVVSDLRQVVVTFSLGIISVSCTYKYTMDRITVLQTSRQLFFNHYI